MTRATQGQLGAAVGISTPAVSDLVRRGVLDLSKGLEKSIIDYCAHLREKAAGRSGGGEYDLTEERARLAHHQANIAALDEKIKEKHLIPVDVVVARWQDILTNVRARLLSIPTQLAATCADEPRTVVEKKANELIKTALEELSTNVDY